MKIEDQVVSSDLAREMQKLGASQDSWLYWIAIGVYAGDWSETFLAMKEDEMYLSSRSDEKCSAYTVAELGEMLPYGATLFIGVTDKWCCCYKNDYELDERAANAYAKMWICLKKEELI